MAMRRSFCGTAVHIHDHEPFRHPQCARVRGLLGKPVMSIAATDTVVVVGAGIMGAGIAQVAAQAGHRVLLFDAREGVAAAARDKLAGTLDGLVKKGRLTAADGEATLARIEPIAQLTQAAPARLVVEAIVESLDAKRTLLAQLEAIVSSDCVLASNTSSISITALANGLQHPGRVLGMHFFNPVPLMKLVEVVAGLKTSPQVAQAVYELAQAWGKQAVHARSSPGFIVNRIARPFYAETLALLAERAAEPAVLDACVRAAGFRMGPCELMDLIGHDTNFAVTESVYQANFGDKRFVPSWVQRELVEGGLLGRKSGQGFYDYSSAPQAAEAPPVPAAALPGAPDVVLHGSGLIIERWAAALTAAGRQHEHFRDTPWNGLSTGGGQLRLTDGRPAAQVAFEEPARDVAVFDVTPVVNGAVVPGSSLAWSAASSASAVWQEQAGAWLAVAGFKPQRLADAAGLVVARTVAMLINEAADAVQQGVCTESAADVAMKLGVNYPAGPFEWLARWDAANVVRVLDHLDAHYRGERYRVSPWLRQRAWQKGTTR